MRRIRVKDSVEALWWLSKSTEPKADNRKVLTAYSEDMRRLLKRGYRPKERPSAQEIWGEPSLLTKVFATLPAPRMCQTANSSLRPG